MSKKDANLKFAQQDVFDPYVILSLILKNWYFFLITIAISFFCARFYIRHTMPVYRSSVSILVNETEDRQIMDNTRLLQGLGLPGGMRNLENQIMILRSATLTERTLSILPFEIEYYFKTLRNKLPIYPETPVKLIFYKEYALPRNIEFSISFLENKRFVLASEWKGYELTKAASFGDDIEVNGLRFHVECLDSEWLKDNKDKKLYFIIHSADRLINSFISRLYVEKVNKDGSILRVSMIGTNTNKDTDFLNKHIEGFQAMSLDRKNLEAERRIEFIDDQLVGISDSLLLTENRLQQFRSSHRVMDLSAQGQAIIGQATLLENEKARLELEANYYDYLADYLVKETMGEMPIVPITMGISDPGLSRLVDELATLQSQLATTGAGQKNPLQRSLEQRVRSAKESLRETLNGLRRANSLARSENQQQINRTNAQAAALPVTERQLLGIERKFELNNELYTFLLETRAEQQMQKASNRADSEIIDPADARFSNLVKPIPMRINLLALTAGIGITYLIIFLNFIFNKKLSEEDLRRITNLPVLGNIPHNNEKTTKVVLDHPKLFISEAYRQLRSRMQFFTKEVEKPVILVTSSIPGEGKTFTAINLSSAYSLLGKKTILIGFDLRKPKIAKDFNLMNEKGVSTWLIGQEELENMIQETNYENLHIITSGPIPPNPSELLALDKTQKLINLLKEEYDCIIIDAPPLGIVSDTIRLISMADVCILVVRPGHSLRDMFKKTNDELIASGVKSSSIVINDSKSMKKQYNYGEIYGYIDEKNGMRKHFLKRHTKDETTV